MHMSHGSRTERRFAVSPLLHVRNLLRPLPSNGRCLQNHYLVTVLHAIISSFLLTQQPYVGFSLFSRFLTVHFSRVWSLASCPTPNLGDLGHFVAHLHSELSDMGGPTRSLCSSQHSSSDHWGAYSPHAKATALEEEVIM
jgi:hypothetical protein